MRCGIGLYANFEGNFEGNFDTSAKHDAIFLGITPIVACAAPKPRAQYVADKGWVDVE